MNEQIKKLAEQVGFELPNNIVNGVNGHGVVTEQEKLTKFAELIVQECILVIEEEAEHIHAEGTIEAIVNLEKHFGVE